MNGKLILSATLIGATCLALPQESHALGSLSADVAFGSNNDQTVISPRLELFIPAGETFAFSADYTLGFLDTANVINISGLNSLNPFVAGHYVKDFGGARLRLGLGAAIPLAKADNISDRVINTVSAGVRGNWNPWTYATKTFSLAAPARMEFKLSDNFVVAGDAGLMLFVPLDSQGYVGDGNTHFGFQLGAEVIVPLGLFGLGGRLRVVSVPTADTIDNTNLSVEPFVQVSAGPAKIKAAFLYNFNTPFGPSFDGGNLNMWGMTFGVGVDF